MRLSPDIASFLKQSIHETIPGSTVYLFGSRTDNNAKGGDIDLLILTEELVAKNIGICAGFPQTRQWLKNE